MNLSPPCAWLSSKMRQSHVEKSVSEYHNKIRVSDVYILAKCASGKTVCVFHVLLYGRTSLKWRNHCACKHTWCRKYGVHQTFMFSAVCAHTHVWVHAVYGCVSSKYSCLAQQCPHACMRACCVWPCLCAHAARFSDRSLCIRLMQTVSVVLWFTRALGPSLHGGATQGHIQ